MQQPAGVGSLPPTLDVQHIALSAAACLTPRAPCLAQELHLEVNQYSTRDPPRFDSALLSGLPRLRRLALLFLGQPNLQFLSVSLRSLHVVGRQIYAADEEVQRVYSLSLPPYRWVAMGVEGCLWLLLSVPLLTCITRSHAH